MVSFLSKNSELHKTRLDQTMTTLQWGAKVGRCSLRGGSAIVNYVAVLVSWIHSEKFELETQLVLEFLANDNISNIVSLFDILYIIICWKL